MQIFKRIKGCNNFYDLYDLMTYFYPLPMFKSIWVPRGNDVTRF